MLSDRPHRVNEIAKALRAKDRVFASFSSAHGYYWTAAVYGGVPSVHKRPQELDYEPWHSQGKTLREELLDIPRPEEKSRVRAHLGLPDTRRGKGGMGNRDLADLVLTHGWKTAKEVLEHAGKERATAPALYDALLGMARSKLTEFVATVWEMEGSRRSSK